MGPIGYKAVFIPTPGFVPFLHPRSTPPAFTLPNKPVTTTATQQRSTSGAVQGVPSSQRAHGNHPVEVAPVQAPPVEATGRSTRILQKRAFRWTNTPYHHVKLGD